MHTESASLEPGAHAGRYVIVDLLGVGGMAMVYRVRHDTLGTEHALKVMQRTNRALRERALSEARTQAHLKHPHIVPVRDVFDLDGSPCVLMDLIDGPSLGDWLERHHPDHESAKCVFRGIVTGVGHAHSQGLIHRDLKPDNVMLSLGPSLATPQITDFGLAKSMMSARKTATGTVFGTPAFMAPEQVRDAASVDRRADIWSLGCILYELFSGASPFYSDDLLDMFARIAVGAYPPLDSSVPEGVRRAVAGCLQIDRTNRIPDARVLLDVLDGKVTTWETHEDVPIHAPVAISDLPTCVPRDLVATGWSRRPTPVASGRHASVVSQPTLYVLEDGDEPPAEVVDRADIEVTESPGARLDPLEDEDLVVVRSPVAAFVASAFGLAVMGTGVVAMGFVVAVVVTMSLIGPRDIAPPESPGVSTILTGPQHRVKRHVVSEDRASDGVVESVAPVVAAEPSSRPSEPEVVPAPEDAAEPEPEADATPEEEPAPEPVSTVAVRFSGAQGVRLVGPGGFAPPLSAVPAGDYSVHARFDAGSEMSVVGRLTVGDQPVQLDCIARAFRCVPQ